MTKKKEDPLSLSLEAPVPEIYMPRLQLFIRLLLGALVALYINYSPIPPLVLSVNQVNLLFVSYYAFHLFWWWYYKKFGANIILFRLGGWVDILGASIGAVSDPFIIPPMLLLFLIAVLGNGIQHGLYFFVESMIGSLILVGAILVIHGSLLGVWPPYPLYFYVFLIVVGVSYSYLLVRRIEMMRVDAIRISEYDSLTGLRNRRSFLKAAEYLLLLNERSYISPVLVFADLDNFKTVNDQFGHDMGDKVLRHFSDIAQSSFRKSDILARYGGDEFVMLLTNTSLETAESAAQRLRKEFGAWAANNGFRTGVSFGLAVVPKGKNNLDDILRQADAALYDAKPKECEISKASAPSRIPDKMRG